MSTLLLEKLTKALLGLLKKRYWRNHPHSFKFTLDNFFGTNRYFIYVKKETLVFLTCCLVWWTLFYPSCCKVPLVTLIESKKPSFAAKVFIMHLNVAICFQKVCSHSVGAAGVDMTIHCSHLTSWLLGLCGFSALAWFVMRLLISLWIINNLLNSICRGWVYGQHSGNSRYEYRSYGYCISKVYTWVHIVVLSMPKWQIAGCNISNVTVFFSYAYVWAWLESKRKNILCFKHQSSLSIFSQVECMI